MKNRIWLFYAILTTLTWGIWGALIEIPERAGFPATLGYSVWAITMIPCALVVLTMIKFKLETTPRSVFLGMTIGLTGAGGQIILFEALRLGPAYIIFPIVSLYPVVTILLSLWLLKERANRRGWIGIFFALAAIFLLSYLKPDQLDLSGYLWLALSLLVFVMWGVQAVVMKMANNTMKAESIFTYMAISAVLLVPFAVWMTDFGDQVNWGFKGPYLAAMIHLLNAIGALSLVYAMRNGKAIIVTPMTSLSPMITIALSLAIYCVFPNLFMIVGFVLALIAIYLFAS
ncbi:MAG: DMT family transporter [Prolixibacteraceae bacterium]|jgi:drug/metabolite transporter (DMT)-like permease|nr:DMT family transporter [Prolixibacteraceae bacterium]